MDRVVACARHNERVGVVVKCKDREARTRGFVDSPVKAWLPKRSGKVGVLLKVSRGLAVGENVAEAAALLRCLGILDHLHLSDKSHAWDENWDGRFGTSGRVSGAGLLAQDT